MHSGGCLCGNIRYRASGDLSFPHLCSCPHCQRLSGSPVMSWVDFPRDGFERSGPGQAASRSGTIPFPIPSVASAITAGVLLPPRTTVTRSWSVSR